MKSITVLVPLCLVAATAYGQTGSYPSLDAAKIQFRVLQHYSDFSFDGQHQDGLRQGCLASTDGSDPSFYCDVPVKGYFKNRIAGNDAFSIVSTTKPTGACTATQPTGGFAFSVADGVISYCNQGTWQRFQSGAVGPQGPAGPAGLVGPIGPTGASGSQGQAGPTGASGNGFTSVLPVPAGSDPNVNGANLAAVLSKGGFGSYQLDAGTYNIPLTVPKGDGINFGAILQQGLIRGAGREATIINALKSSGDTTQGFGLSGSTLENLTLNLMDVNSPTIAGSGTLTIPDAGTPYDGRVITLDNVLINGTVVSHNAYLFSTGHDTFYIPYVTNVRNSKITTFGADAVYTTSQPYFTIVGSEIDAFTNVNYSNGQILCVSSYKGPSSYTAYNGTCQ